MNVQVWNHNIHPYTEVFRDRTITIAPNSFVEMDEDEADYFMQTFKFPVKDAQGRPDPKHFKKLKIEIPPEVMEARQQKQEFINHANGARLSSSEELRDALRSFAHLTAERDPDGEAEAVKQKNRQLAKENKILKSRLELIEERLGLNNKEEAPNEEAI